MELTYQWADDFVDSVRQVLAAKLGFYETSTALRAQVPGDPPQEPGWSLVRAFEYRLTERPGAADPATRIYSPMIEFKEGPTHPERVGEATPETLNAWADAVELFHESDLLQARLGDLLWLRRHGDAPHLYARSAQAALRRLWGYEGLHRVEQADCLVRSSHIAMELADVGLVTATAAEVVQAARTSLDEEDYQPGVVMRLIECLAGLPKAQRPEADIDALLRDATDKYSEDPFILSHVLQLRMSQVTDTSDRQSLAAIGIAAWEKLADSTDSFVRQMHLERALELATTNGMTGEITRLRARMQESRGKDLGMKAITATVEIPRDKLEAFFAQFVTDDAVHSLTRFALHCPIEVDRDKVAEQVRKAMADAPLQFLMSKVVVNPEGLPMIHVTGEEEHFRQAVTEHDSRAISFWGLFAIEALERIESNGQLSDHALQSYFAPSLFNEEATAGIIRAFEHYREGRFEEALFCVLPRIEGILRDISFQVGLVVFVEPGSSGTGIGRYKGLGDLLRGLEGFIPDEHRRYLELLLGDPLGVNLRNRAFHGLMTSVGQQDAVLALHAVMLIGAWRAGPSRGDDETTEPEAT